MQTIFPILLMMTAVLCTLTTGLVYTFAVVTMPGIKKLSDGEFIRAFQVMDGIIQDGHPLFMLVWVGSVLSLIATTIIGFGQLTGVPLGLLVIATALYIVGVQLPTVTINVPLNNHLQTLNVDAMDTQAQQAERRTFEARWNQSNVFRTFVGVIVSVLLMMLMLMV